MKRETRIIPEAAAVGRPLALKVVGTGRPEYPLPDRGRVTIGGDPTNDLVVADEFVSGFHAFVELSGHPARAFLHDCGSRNGSYVNGARVLAIEIDRGSRITVGQTTLSVVDLETPGVPGEMAVGLIGRSPGLRNLIEQARRVAPSKANVLIHGETGSGKELVARLLHDASPRARAPFVVVNCGAIPRELVESEFFGHERGAFTGATERRQGVFEMAHRGTLFLDEVGELPLEHQARLLRVLETRKVRRVGGGAEQTVDVRVLAATHRDLEDDVRASRFRLDLFHRLSTVALAVPALRDRPEDIPVLAEHFLSELEPEVGPRRISAAAYEAMLGYPWPGNVRELRNAIARAAIMTEGRDLHSRDFVGMVRPPPSAPAEPPRGSRHFVEYCRDIYANALIDAGSLRRAARKLGIPKSTLQDRIRRLGLPMPND